MGEAHRDVRAVKEEEGEDDVRGVDEESSFVGIFCVVRVRLRGDGGDRILLGDRDLLERAAMSFYGR